MKKVVLFLLFTLGLKGVLSAATITIGEYAGYNSSTSYPSPYANYNGGHHEQYLITADEIQAEGVDCGQINSLSFWVDNVNGCGPLERYQIHLGETTSSELTGFIPPEDLTRVFYANPYQPVEDWNAHILDDPWIWDGSSNIVVDINHRTDETSYNASVFHANTSSSYRCLYQEGLSYTQSYLRPVMKLVIDGIQIEIGGEVTEESLLPVSGLHNHSYSQCLYRQEEIGVQGLYATRIAYFWNGTAANANSAHWTIYMGHKAGDVFSSNSDWLPLAQLTQVFDGIVHLPASPGWVEIILDTPFAYDNVNNLVIAVDENSPGNDNPSGLFRNTVSAEKRGLIAISANDVDPAAPGASINCNGFADVILSFLPEPLGPPAPPLPVYPPEGYSGTELSGIDLIWGPDANGGLPDSYTLYLANDPGQIFAQHSFPGLTANHYDPVSQGGVSFVYGQQWYWAVRAVNTEGNAVFSPPRSFSVFPYPAAVPPAEQHFDGPDFPVGWSQTHSGGITQDCWEVSNTSYAGGTAYELKFTAPFGQSGVSRLISQPVSTGSGSGFWVSFRYRVQTTQPGFSFRLQYSHDLRNWQDSQWEFDPQTDYLSGTVTVFISGLSWPYTFLGFTLEGTFSSSIYCAIDDLVLAPVLEHDVGVGKILQVGQVMDVSAVFAGARIFNYGNNVQSFDVFMRSGVRFTDTQTVTDLAPGAFVDVYFDPFIPETGEVNQIEVRSLLTGDNNPDNDVLFLDFACVNLDVPALVNVALDPASQLSGPASFNLGRPANVSDLPGAAVAPSSISGGCWVNGEWWFLQDYSWNLWKVDPISGNATVIGNTGEWNMKGLSQAGPGLPIYACSEDRLYTLDPVTGAASEVGGYFGTGGGMASLASDAAGNTLYGINIYTDALYTIDTSTGQASLVGPLGFELSYFTLDCAFDQDNGSLFLATPDFTSALFWIDTASGRAYRVGNFPSGTQMTGFAIPFGPPEAPVVCIEAGGALHWDPVYRATSYYIYGSESPDGGFSLLDITTSTSWTDPAYPQNRRFYRVTASN